MPSPSQSLAASILLVGGLIAQTPPLQFSDVTAASGIVWQQVDSGFLMGAGGAVLDFDGDGHEDLLFAGGVGTLGLYRNLGDGTFHDVTAGSGLTLPSGVLDVMGAVAADFDNDGDPDLYVFANGRNALFENRYPLAFAEVGMAAGVADARWTCAAAFGDYDADGDLDLYVGNYIASLAFPYHVPHPNALYRNEGNGTFTDVTAQTGVAGAGTTLAVTWVDFDGDGDQDIWVGNDFGRWVEQNRLYRNDGPALGGDWAFTEVSAAMGADQGLYCMGLTAADVDRDLDLDMYMSNLGANAFLRNDGPFGFADITSITGTEVANDPFAPSLLATSWSVGFHDFDSDGWIDLYVSNGHIPSAPFLANGVATPNSLFRHTGPSLAYEDVSALANVQHTGKGRGSAFADLDNDGDMDIVQFNLEGPPVLLRNDSPAGHAYLVLELSGTASNRDAFGARLQADVGGVSHLRYVHANYGFESSSTPRVHFGLGSASIVDRLTISWPSGRSCRLHRVPVFAHLKLREPSVIVDTAASLAPSAISAGSTLTLQMVLRNTTGVPKTVRTLKSLEIAGGPLAYADTTEVVTVPANGTRVRSWVVDIPAGMASSGNVPVSVFWSVIGADLSVDQWEACFVVTP